MPTASRFADQIMSPGRPIGQPQSRWPIVDAAEAITNLDYSAALVVQDLGPHLSIKMQESVSFLRPHTVKHQIRLRSSPLDSMSSGLSMIFNRLARCSGRLRTAARLPPANRWNSGSYVVAVPRFRFPRWRMVISCSEITEFTRSPIETVTPTTTLFSTMQADMPNVAVRDDPHALPRGACCCVTRMTRPPAISATCVSFCDQSPPCGSPLRA